jgi:pimeloyl-ACP methyl ester carboxylesterase
VWPALASRYRVIALDLIGFGLSAKPIRFAYTVMSQADLCQGLLAHCGVNHYHILAEDYGDTVAQELLAREAGTIASVCMLNGGVFPEAHRASRMQKLITARLGRPLASLVMRRGFHRALFKLFGPETKPSADTLDALWTLLRHNRGRAVMPRLMGYRADRKEHRDRWVSALIGVRIPMRFLFGMQDPMCDGEMADLWRACVPGGDVVELPGIGHFPALEAPAAVAEAYLAFRRAHAPSMANDRPPESR